MYTYCTSDDWIDDIIVRTKDDFGGFEQQSCTIVWTRIFINTQTHYVFDIPNRWHSELS